MILDSSIILSILFKEPGFEPFLERLLKADYLGVSTATLLETGIVLIHRLGPPGMGALERFVALAGFTEVPFGPEHWREAVEAYIAYGKGRNPSRLNFGDCISYATARVADRELLYRGNDFALTDKRHPET